MTLLIFGTRFFADYALLCERCDFYTKNHPKIEVITGCPDKKDRGHFWRPGADGLGERWALERNHGYRNFPADWKRWGNPAGPIRNREMQAHLIAAPGPKAGIGFWDGQSRGTRDMAELLQQADIPMKMIYYLDGK